MSITSIFSRRTARAGIATAAIAAAVISLAGCSGSTPSSDTTPGDAGAADYGTVNLQLSWIKDVEFSGEFLADSKGYFKDAGISTVNMTPGPSTGTSELLSGKADVALSDAVSVGSAVSQGQPLKIIGTEFQKNPFTILSLGEKTPLKSPKDLIGKKIGVDDSNTVLFNAFLSVNGIDPKDVTVVPGQFNGPALLESGQVDGYVSYLTNEGIQVELDGYTPVNLAFADFGLPFVAETVTVTQDSIDNDRDKLVAFLKAEVQGWSDFVKDPQSGADLATGTYGKDLKLDPKLEAAAATAQAGLVATDETATNGLFTISDELQQETIASLKAAGITTTAKDLFDMSLLADVYKANPDLVDYSK
ncbi:ABC transporter substrate-binding protein [Galbitalea sp. SE-J8]|uniref:ABC transporter substrate-binding protein n=1 Tax=Galbitalea sp. SE-J8 TaxID=3054952 RepID=UPI00259D25C9|nr:ABC transporter substrate-binding protein [Galbitalea sp. SE-J8]MDM4763414.1 ABC transporter substrate-binding protein [Galbitalea sp. SE-J8]